MEENNKCKPIPTPKPCDKFKGCEMAGIAYTDENGNIVKFVNQKNVIVEK